ncbi:hypothetical protein Tco_1338107 [Tanacetum coccineum]
MGSNEETNAAGTDTRPPMLVESDYDSWKIRIHRYIRGKPNGKLIWKSIQNGPTPHPMITDPPPTDSTIVPAPRKKLDSEFSEEENKLEMADTQAEIILSQGLPRHIFNKSSSNKHCKRRKGKISNTKPMTSWPKRSQKQSSPTRPSTVPAQCHLMTLDGHYDFKLLKPLKCFQKQFSQPTKQPASDFPPTQGLPCYVHVREGHVASSVQETQEKAGLSVIDKDKALLMEAKEKGDVLDAEAAAYLADMECNPALMNQPKGTD